MAGLWHGPAARRKNKASSTIKTFGVRPPSLGAFLRPVLDLVLPPLCLSCGATIAENGGLCPSCWGAVTFLGDPLCACCGLPFDVDYGPDALCGACAAGPAPFRRARAALRYDEGSRALILAFKHADRLEGAPAFARWMARAGAPLLADADLIAPVPLHRWRLWRRRYNQAALLALALARQTGVPALPDLLIRPRATASMGRLSPAERERNVRGAFAIHPRRRDALAGRTVLLVDDVMTSGATIAACARVLKAGGARAVDVLTLARALR